MEKIIRIEETNFKKSKDDWDDWDDFDGYAVITDKQTIKLGISNHQSCCENWGYFMSEDNLKDFENAELIEIQIVDNCLKPKKLDDIYEGKTMFVNLETTKGTLQFTAYNSHNGYYSHDAVVISKQLKTEESL